MKRLKGLPAGRTLKGVITGSADQNVMFTAAIGDLIVQWSNNESVFLAMLKAALDTDDHAASIIWYAHRTIKGRLELLGHLLRERISDADIIRDVGDAISIFNGPTKTRNFYCHAIYSYDTALRLSVVSGYSLSDDGTPLRSVDKRMDARTLNEINSAKVDLVALNGILWRLVERIRGDIAAQREARSQQPSHVPSTKENHHPTDGDEAPPAPPAP